MTRDPPVVIQVDYRERSSSIPELLEAREGVRVHMRSLRAADYVFGDIGAAERKTYQDFARSVVDGRLFRQVTVMCQRYPRPFLILEKLRVGCDAESVRWSALRGALISVTVVFGVLILFSSGVEETADLIVQAARQIKRISGDTIVRPGYRPKGFRKRALFILQGLPWIGPKRAKMLFNEFGSVEAVFTADLPSLLRVSGIGPEVANAIRVAVGPHPK